MIRTPGHFVSEGAQVVPQLRLVDRSRHRLRTKEFVWLKRSVIPFGVGRHVEHYGVCMEVRGRVTVYWACGVVFERCCRPASGSLWRGVASCTSLCVPLQVIESFADCLAMGLADALVFSDEGGKRDGFRSIEREVPSSAMRDFLSFSRQMGIPMTDDLVPGPWVLAVSQAVECLRFDRPSQAEVGGELAVPLALERSGLGEVRVGCGRVFALVIILDLGGYKGF